MDPAARRFCAGPLTVLRATALAAAVARSGLEVRVFFVGARDGLRVAILHLA